MGKQNRFQVATDVLTDLPSTGWRIEMLSPNRFFLISVDKASALPFTPAPRNQGKY